MADSTLALLTAATDSTGGLFYGTQSGADRKFTLTAAGAALVEAADATAQRAALALGTIATQAANNIAITGGSISGLTTFESSDPDFTVDSHGNLTAKYFKLTNSGSNQTSLHLAAVSGAVPSTICWLQAMRRDLPSASASAQIPPRA